MHRFENCQFFNYELNAEVPKLIQPTILQIFARNWLHRVFGFTEVHAHAIKKPMEMYSGGPLDIIFKLRE